MNKIDVKRIGVFLLFAFGIAWATGLVIYMTGGLANTPRLGGAVPLAVFLLATSYMWAPALANILTRLVTREGWKDTHLRINLRRDWTYWLICWLAPGILIFLGMGLFFVIFPQYYDPTLGTMRKLIEQQLSQSPAGAGRQVPDNLWPTALAQLGIGMLIAPIVNALATFGEEFGWRGYLLYKLLPLGSRTALILSGIIWGIWHWPIIMMGADYGFNYPGFPWTGMLLFLVFTTAFGTFSGWATLKTNSVWPAVIGHGAVNGMAGAAILFVKGQPSLLMGPAVNGLIGGIPFVIVALVILFSGRAMRVHVPARAAENETAPA